MNNIEDFDVLVTGYYEFNGVKEEVYPLKECRYHSNDEIKEAYIDGALTEPFKTVWGKLYRRSAINSCFNEDFISGEDGVFNLTLLTKVKAVKVLRYCGYHKVSVRSDSITHISALGYTHIREHKYLSEKAEFINAIKRDWGWKQEDFLSANRKSIPTRYYKEIVNLLQADSPYSKKEVLQKIKEIHADKEFAYAILVNRYRDLSARNKIVKFSVQVNSPKMTRMIFKTILKIRTKRHAR